MNWKPKKGVGKTLYAIDIWFDFNSVNPYGVWTSDSYFPTIEKYTDVMILTNGINKRRTFIIAKNKSDSTTNKKIKDNEYKTYELKKIDSINEDKKGVVIIKGNKTILSNDKKEILNIVTGLYKNKEIEARKTIDDYKAGAFGHYFHNSSWLEEKIMEQPKCVMESYKNFVEKLKKI